MDVVLNIMSLMFCRFVVHFCPENVCPDNYYPDGS